MRITARLLCLLAIALLATVSGCGFLAGLLGFEESQRDWVGNPADGNERHSAEKRKNQAEIDAAY
jgi:hypothetical protein